MCELIYFFCVCFQHPVLFFWVPTEQDHLWKRFKEKTSSTPLTSVMSHMSEKEKQTLVLRLPSKRVTKESTQLQLSDPSPLSWLGLLQQKPNYASSLPSLWLVIQLTEKINMTKKRSLDINRGDSKRPPHPSFLSTESKMSIVCGTKVAVIIIINLKHIHMSIQYLHILTMQLM